MTRSKYRSPLTKREKPTCDGYMFDSQREMLRYKIALRPALDDKAIYNLEVHPRFLLLEGFTDAFGLKHLAVHYTADFGYYIPGWPTRVIEDQKAPLVTTVSTSGRRRTASPTETQVFKLKRKLFARKYDNAILVVVYEPDAPIFDPKSLKAERKRRKKRSR